eukprot:TRINITY_DN5517_c0_g1_i3.p1 TRINITY_DN5517_c0_g1~~TRINITY_DN5517_c0_g1_i3.p1  ORF type:complete len:532 (+),score=94.08 TRINITY_DN5517_c0_g1_i3:113-1708(+)
MVLAGVLAASFASSASGPPQKCDVIVFGATPAGVAAAVSASRTAAATGAASRVCLLEPTAYIGGMSSPGGIGLRDFGKTSPCCTMVEWAMNNSAHYGTTSPVWQPDNYVGEQSFRTLVSGAKGVDLYTQHGLVEGGVKMDGKRIASVTTRYTPDGQQTEWSAGQFIDASYEGDVARFAGASITWGRESHDQYGEELAGVLDPAPSFEVPVNATASNGALLKYVSAERPGPKGSGDDGVMAFSYRVCVTRNESNRLAFTKPENYNASDFELMKSYIADQIAAGKSAPSFGKLFGVYGYRGYPREKHDLCDANTYAVTSDAPDLQKGYMNGTEETRAKIRANVRYYVQGYLYLLSTDAGIPSATRKSVNEYGLCKDEWPENGHFPPQMYVREGVRLVGDKVFTQNDWKAAKTNDSVGLGSWGLDIHVVHRYRGSDGFVHDEGYTPYSTGAHVFQLPYSMLMPKRAEVQNLAVPVCLSCSHVTWAGLREEPTLWLLGMAAGTSSVLSGSKGVLQDVEIPLLQKHLASQGVKTSL